MQVTFQSSRLYRHTSSTHGLQVTSGLCVCAHVELLTREYVPADRLSFSAALGSVGLMARYGSIAKQEPTREVEQDREPSLPPLLATP